MKSNLFTRSICGLVAALAFGCGSVDMDTGLANESSDLGRAEQAFNAPRTTTYVLGSTQTQAALKCTRTNASQVCTIPTTRVMTYCYENLTPVQAGWADAIVAAKDSTNHFTWTKNPATGTACDNAFVAGTVNVMVNAVNNVCGTAGGSTTNIDSLVCLAPVVVTTAQLPENPSVPGSFFGINGGVIHIDNARLTAAFSGANLQEAARHGVVHAALALEGIGARSDSNATFLWSRRQTQPFIVQPGFLDYIRSSGEDCILAHYSSALQPGVYGTDSTSCSVD